LLETHFNIQRRLYDYQFALTTSPAELEQVHQEFIQTYNTTAHQGLLEEGVDPPIPLEVLAEAKGASTVRTGWLRSFRVRFFPEPRTAMAV
jgi:hypothetical protein